MTDAYETLAVERNGPVGWLIFDRPDVGNAMNAQMLEELERAWIELDDDPDVRVIVNTGNGRTFQTGVDVQQLARDKDALREQSRRTRDATLKMTAWHNGIWKPVIAAVNGVCAGGGLHFVADADIVLASSDATFVDPHVSVGQVTSYEVIALARKAPMEAILRMALVGAHERISAERARELGILSEVVEPERLRPAAQELAEKIARNSPTAMARTKRALWGALELGLTDACRAGAKELVAMWGHPDQTEGPLAFAEEAAGEVVAAGVSASYQRLVVERRGPVGWILNDRPERLNAYDDTMRAEFRQAYLAFDADPEVRVIVHGAHGRAFQVGVDIADLREGAGAARYEREMLEFDLGLTGWHLGVQTPVVVAINGMCAGGGLHWLADADVVLAASDAVFTDPHVSVGQVSAVEPVCLARRAPFEAVMRLALVGSHERMSAARAYELGLVSQVVDPPERLHEVVQEVAERIAAGDPDVIATRKRDLWRAQERAGLPGTAGRTA